VDYHYPTMSCYLFFRRAALPWRSPFLNGGAFLPPNGFFLAAIRVVYHVLREQDSNLHRPDSESGGLPLPPPRNVFTRSPGRDRTYDDSVNSRVLCR
jgi:hypothetical protein